MTAAIFLNKDLNWSSAESELYRHLSLLSERLLEFCKNSTPREMASGGA